MDHRNRIISKELFRVDWRSFEHASNN
jgi:hypothetical protein